jgi:hypothetical protein
MDGSTQANDHGLISATAGILAGLFGHRISSWSLQTTVVRCRFDGPDAYTNRLSNMLVCRQTGSRLQPVVIHSRDNHSLRHTAAFPGAHDNILCTSL